MTRSLLDSILSMVTPDMKQALASRLGQSLEGVQSGLGAATAATLSGLDRRAADSEFLGQILGLLDGGAGPSIVASLASIAASAPSGTAAETISSFVRMLFGSQQAEVAGAISQHAGLSATSGPALLKVSAAVVLAYFVKGHSAGALTVDSLSSMLRAEAPTLHSYLPASLLPGAPAAVSSIPRRAVFAPPAVLWAVGAMACAMLALALGTIALVVALWNGHRMLALLGGSLGFVALTVFFSWLGARALRTQPDLLEGSLAQLKQDQRRAGSVQ